MATRRLLQCFGAFIPALLLAFYFSFSGTAAAQAAQSSVTIQNFVFDPTPLTVKVGDMVTWTNMDTAPHNAVADDGSFKTPDLQKGQSATLTLTTPGEHAYICTIHPRMKGTLIVQAASTGGAAPGLPSTGGGGMAGRSTAPLGLLAGLGLLFALGAVVVVQRRWAR